MIETILKYNFLQNAIMAAVLASTSQRSLSGLPVWPRTQLNLILCVTRSGISRRQRSWFLTGFFSALSQPFFCHEASQRFSMASWT